MSTSAEDQGAFDTLPIRAKRGAMETTVATVTRRYTYKDLLDTPDDGQRYEIIDGELIVSPSPSVAHQKLSFRLTLVVGNFVTEHRLGEVFAAPLDVRLGDDTVEPDLIYVSRARLGIVKRNFIQGAPDLLIEILSPGTRHRDLGQKRDLYARFGVPEYWWADARRRSLTIETLRDGRYEPVAHEAGIVRSNVLPGLAIGVADLFADLG